MMVWLGFPGVPSQITTVFLSSSSTCFDSVPAEGVSETDTPFPSASVGGCRNLLPPCLRRQPALQRSYRGVTIRYPSSLIVYPVNFDRVPRANPNTLIFERVRRAGSHSIFSVADGTAIRRPIWASTYATAGGVVDKNVRGCIKSTARAPLHAAAHRFFGTFQVKAENTPVNPHRKRQNRPGAVFRVRGDPCRLRAL